MHARDIMQPDVTTVTPDTLVAEIAQLLIEKRIGAVPVRDERGDLIGMVSESDLLRRSELDTERRRRNGLLGFFTSVEALATEYAAAHGRRARDVMTHPVVTVTPDTALSDIVELMERKRIRRVPVVERTAEGQDGLAGIVTRSDLVRALATLIPNAPALDPSRHLADEHIRAMLMAELGRQRWTDKGEGGVTVHDGVVHLWGRVSNEAEGRALIALAEGIPGVAGVQDHTWVGHADFAPIMP